MSIYRARLRNISNALTLRISSEQIHLQISPKLFGVNSLTSFLILQWKGSETRTENKPSHWTTL